MTSTRLITTRFMFDNKLNIIKDLGIQASLQLQRTFEVIEYVNSHETSDPSLMPVHI